MLSCCSESAYISARAHAFVDPQDAIFRRLIGKESSHLRLPILSIRPRLPTNRHLTASLRPAASRDPSQSFGLPSCPFSTGSLVLTCKNILCRPYPSKIGRGGDVPQRIMMPLCKPTWRRCGSIVLLCEFLISCTFVEVVVVSMIKAVRRSWQRQVVVCL